MGKGPGNLVGRGRIAVGTNAEGAGGKQVLFAIAIKISEDEEAADVSWEKVGELRADLKISSFFLKHLELPRIDIPNYPFLRAVTVEV